MVRSPLTCLLSIIAITRLVCDLLTYLLATTETMLATESPKVVALIWSVRTTLLSAKEIQMLLSQQKSSLKSVNVFVTESRSPRSLLISNKPMRPCTKPAAIRVGSIYLRATYHTTPSRYPLDCKLNAEIHGFSV